MKGRKGRNHFTFHALRFTFLALWLSGFTNAWSKLEFAGFLENRIEWISRNDDSPLNPNNQILNLGDISNQLRLRLSIDTAEYSAAGAHARISYFDTPTDARFRHEALVDEAFLNLDLPGRINCIFGKKRLAWGTAFLWNPTDVLSPPKNPQDPEPGENREGAFVVKLERSFGNVTVTGVIAPERIEEVQEAESPVSTRLENTQLVGKVDWLVADTDLTGLVQYRRSTGRVAPARSKEAAGKWRFGVSFSQVIFGATEIHGEFIGGRGFMRSLLQSPAFFKGTVPLLTKKGLGEVRFSPSDNPIVAGLVLGLHHSFPSNTRLILEYYHNDEGYSATEIDQFVNVIQTLHTKHANDSYQQYLAGVSQEVGALTGNLRKNYAYVRLMQPRINDVLTLEGNLLWNLDDKSLLLFAEGEYETAMNLFVFLRADFPINFTGEGTSEFGGLGVRSQSLRLGAKIYF